MKKITRMVAVTFLALVGWQANAQNGGDDCASAVVAVPGTFTDTTITDTTVGTGDGDAAWFSYTAEGDGTITIDGSIDPELTDTRVFILDNCTDLTQLDFDDDDGDGNTSLIADFPVTSGTNYIIQWDDRWSVAPFDWELSFTPAPTGDTCADALPIEPGVFVDATINDVTPGIGNGDALWYSYTAATNGSITIDSSINPDDLTDTRVFILDNCSDLTQLATDDDGGDGNTSLIADFPVVAGTNYIIQWDDRWSVAPFDWELSFTSCVDPIGFAVTAGQTDAVFTWLDAPGATNGYIVEIFDAGADPEVDTALFTELVAAGEVTVTIAGLTEVTSYDAYITSDCDTAGTSNGDATVTFATSGPPGPNATCDTALVITEGIFVAQIVDATPGTNNGDSIWYSYTATSNGAITIDSSIDTDNPDTRVFVFDNCTDLTELAMDDDGGGATTSLIADFPVVAGTSYFIEWDDRWTADEFDWELSFASCIDPTDFAVTAGQTDAVFTWADVPEATNGYIVEIFDAGADPEVDTALFTELVAAGEVTVTIAGLTELTPYDAYITSDCDTAGTSIGDAMVTFTTTTAPGPNATCDTALVITEGMFVAQIVDAAPGTNNGDSIWYSYTPAQDGTVVISSCGGDIIDTRVFLSEGTCDALVAVDQDDDGCDAPDGFSSVLSDIPVTAGTEYFIQWDDRWSADEFDWELILTSTGPECEAAQNFAVSNITDTTIDLTWDVAPTALDGYQTAVYLEGDVPLVDAPIYASAVLAQATTADTATGLTTGVDYDAYLFTICDLGEPVFVLSDPITFNTILGIEDSAIVSYTIFPNPASSQINLTAAFNIENVVVSNILGQQVMANRGGSQELTLDIANLSVGTYFMKATVNGIDVVERFIKQ